MRSYLIRMFNTKLYYKKRVTMVAIMVIRCVSMLIFPHQFESTELQPPYTPEVLSAIKPLTPDLIRRNVTKVIVNAYYRSGSSLLGRMFKYHNSPFYNFEPFMVSFLRYKKERGWERDDNTFVNSKTGNYR